MSESLHQSRFNFEATTAERLAHLRADAARDDADPVLRSLRTHLAGRPIIRRDVESRHLLSGFAKCATCGGALSVVSRAHGARRAFFYGCLAYHKRGPAVCTNSLVLPVAAVEQAVLRAFGGTMLRPAVVQAVLDGVFAMLEPDRQAEAVSSLRAELRQADQAIQRLTSAIEAGGALGPLLQQLRARLTEQEALQRTLAQRAQERSVDRADVERQVLCEVERWRVLLTNEHVEDGRQFLREVLEGPLVFRPEGRMYRFDGPVTFGKAIEGLVLPPWVASPTGLATRVPAVGGPLPERPLAA